ncbi:MAG: response regulator [SAR202 cluster bacterium]|nr:response regulator [SAR202 cluster bacterium]
MFGPTEEPTTVLVVDDERPLVMDMLRRLARLGLQPVGMAYDGEEAVLEAARLRPNVVLMDIRMPGRLHGFQAGEAIEDTTDAAVVYLTAADDPAAIRRAKASAPFSYVLKPVEDEPLRAAIANAASCRALELRIRNRVAEINRLTSLFRRNLMDKQLAVEPCQHIADDLWGCHDRLTLIHRRMKTSPLQPLADHGSSNAALGDMR